MRLSLLAKTLFPPVKIILAEFNEKSSAKVKIGALNPLIDIFSNAIPCLFRKTLQNSIYVLCLYN